MRRVQIPLRHFFATPPTPCPYLADRLERKVVTLLSGENPAQLHEALSQAGFRRSQDLAYRPACDTCNACVPVRVPVARSRLTRGQRRILKRNEELIARQLAPLATREHFALFRSYLTARHPGGGMADMDFADYRAMVEDTPVDSHLVEFREPGGRLACVCLTDRMSDGLSLIYSFFDPARRGHSLGSFVILWHIGRARALELEHVYLGYWIRDSRKMAYKGQYRPLEALTPSGWREIDPARYEPSEGLLAGTELA